MNYEKFVLALFLVVIIGGVMFLLMGGMLMVAYPGAV